MTTLQQAAVREAIRRAFNCSRFNLSGITDACKVMGLRYLDGSDDWHVLEVMHCVPWANLSPNETRDLLALCARVLGVEVEMMQQVFPVQQQLPSPTC